MGVELGVKSVIHTGAVVCGVLEGGTRVLGGKGVKVPPTRS